MAMCPSIRWAALLLAALSPLSSADLSGFYEIDLIFPRNGSTFSAEGIPPLVFGVQNPIFSDFLNVIVTWTLTPRGNDTSGGFEYTIYGSNLGLPVESYPLSSMVGIEQEWDFSWQLQWQNGSATPENQNPQTFWLERYISFNTSASSPPPDLVAATSPGECNMTSNVAFNIAKVDTANSSDYIYLAPSVTPSPCAITINASQASSIAAKATQWACSGYNPVLSAARNRTCKNYTLTSAGSRLRLRRGGDEAVSVVQWLAVPAVTLLAMIVFLY